MLDDLMSNPWAYMPPKSSLWLWVGGPLMILLVYFLTTRSQTEKRKRLREAEIWRASIAPERTSDQGKAPSSSRSGAAKKDEKAKKDDKAKKDEKKKPVEAAGPPRVLAIPPTMRVALEAVGGGNPIAHYELVPELAYLSLVEANETAGSDYQAVTAKLEERGPAMLIRPLPLVDGARVQNTGVQFKKDPEFMENFLVEGPDAKAIGKWLPPALRRALCEAPWVWLRVDGRTLTVSGFGTFEADKLDRLVEIADAIVAEHGAEGGPSLFGDHSERAAPEPAAPKKKKAAVAPHTTTLAETPVSKKKI